MKNLKENIVIALFVFLFAVGVLSCCKPRISVYCDPCPVEIDTIDIWKDYYDFINGN